jgi:cytochrome c oxidase subunit III
MATTLPPVIEDEPIVSDDGTTGNGGTPRDPDDDSYRRPERDPVPPATPLSVYRTLTCWIIVWVVMLFAALTAVVKARWARSDDWVSVTLPPVLYLNTAILIASSVTIEFARRPRRAHGSKTCVRWLLVTLALGVVFLAGQIAAWRELVSRGLYLASNPGSFFIYLISGAHGLHLIGGITALAFIAIFFGRWEERAKRETAVNAMTLYWHFMDGLWIYLLALLFITIQR